MASTPLTPQRRFPDVRTLEWVARSVGAGARVVGGRRLIGGITSSMHRLAVETRRGSRIQLILRRWTPTAWGDWADAPELVQRESHVLRVLESTDIPAPRLLATDANGSETGVSCLLMTRLPGRMDLTPADPRAWLRQMVDMAVRIHALQVEAPPYEWEPKVVPVPAWTTRPDDWRAAAEVVRGAAPDHEERFGHSDYQHFNLLWQRGRLSGVVDWVSAFRGPADVDVAHCRLNLAVLYSAELASEFLAAYEAEAGRRIDPYWDIRSATSPARHDWASFIPIQVGGRVPFDADAMRRRLDAHLAAALRRT